MRQIDKHLCATQWLHAVSGHNYTYYLLYTFTFHAAFQCHISFSFISIIFRHHYNLILFLVSAHCVLWKLKYQFWSSAGEIWLKQGSLSSCTCAHDFTQGVIWPFKIWSKHFLVLALIVLLLSSIHQLRLLLKLPTYLVVMRRYEVIENTDAGRGGLNLPSRLYSVTATLTF